jgi:hypothetical protein
MIMKFAVSFGTLLNYQGQKALPLDPILTQFIPHPYTSNVGNIFK